MTGRIVDLEAWLTGTPSELDAATAQLATLGHIAQAATHPLGGAERGRHRRYLRIAITPAAPSQSLPDAA